jgi:hypothetical protein
MFDYCKRKRIEPSENNYRKFIWSLVVKKTSLMLKDEENEKCIKNKKEQVKVKGKGKNYSKNHIKKTKNKKFKAKCEEEEEENLVGKMVPLNVNYKIILDNEKEIVY